MVSTAPYLLLNLYQKALNHMGELDISDKRVWWINFAYINNTQYFVTRAYFPTIFGK